MSAAVRGADAVRILYPRSEERPADYAELAAASSLSQATALSHTPGADITMVTMNTMRY